jgi:DNA-binding transcriptional LysR family regulator
MLMDRLQAMKVFEQVVAQKSFVAGARKLGISRASATRRVQDLEDHLGVQLLQRSTRRLALTAAGDAYFVRVRNILSDIDEAEKETHDHSTQMSGTVRVLALPGVATHLVAPAIAEFHRQHVHVTIELQSDILPSRSLEGVDLALLTDQLPLPASGVVRPIMPSEGILCASADYLRRHGAPLAPDALREHALIRLERPGLSSGAFRLVHEADPLREERLDLRATLTCNDHEVALRGTLEGAGISSQSRQVAMPFLQAGRLERVLSPWLAERCMLVATFASRRHMPPRVRAFLDHLLQHAAQVRADIEKSVLTC